MDWANDNPNEGAWFDMPADLGGGRIQLRVLPPALSRQVRVKTQGTQQVDYHKDEESEEVTRHVSFPTPDVELADQLTWDYCIQTAEDAEGKILELTAVQKAKQVNENVMFNLFISQSLAKLSSDQLAFRKALEKNLPASSSGTAKSQIVKTA